MTVKQMFEKKYGNSYDVKHRQFIDWVKKNFDMLVYDMEEDERRNIDVGDLVEYRHSIWKVTETYNSIIIEEMFTGETAVLSICSKFKILKKNVNTGKV